MNWSELEGAAVIRIIHEAEQAAIGQKLPVVRIRFFLCIFTYCVDLFHMVVDLVNHFHIKLVVDDHIPHDPVSIFTVDTAAVGPVLGQSGKSVGHG